MSDFLEQIDDEIKKLMNKEDRQDVEFRFNVLVEEIGDLAKYIIHDQKLNSNARPHGSFTDEQMAYGQAFIQLIAAAQLRGIDIRQAIAMGLENWQKADWRKAQASDDNNICGLTATNGIIEAIAFVDPEAQNLDQLDGHILVTRFIKTTHTPFFSKIKGLITDHGSLASHAAILSREYNLPCVVGTGNATEKIKHGQTIRLIADTANGKVIIL
jgi:phosphohistidine swiveling domain-containing protein